MKIKMKSKPNSEYCLINQVRNVLRYYYWLFFNAISWLYLYSSF